MAAALHFMKNAYLAFAFLLLARYVGKPEHPADVRKAGALLLGFPDNASAGACVGEIIAAGIIPAGLEMMDKPAIEAAEAFCQPGYPMDVASILICELDGTATAAETDHMVTETLIRSMYRYWRDVMDI